MRASAAGAWCVLSMACATAGRAPHGPPRPAAVAVPALAPAAPEPARAPAPAIAGELEWRLEAHARTDGRPLVAFGADGGVLWVRPGDGGHALVALSPAGETRWELALPDAHRAELLAATSDGGAIVAGDVVLGWRFVLRVDPGGEVGWTRELQVKGWPRQLAVAGDDTVVLTGSFHGSVDFGGGALQSVFPAGSGKQSDFVLKLDAAGQHQWSKVFAPGINAAARTPDGGVVIGSHLPRGMPIDYGTGPVMGPGVVAKLDADGRAAWARHLDAGVRQVAIDGGGAPAVVTFPDAGGARLARLDGAGGVASSAVIASRSPTVAFDRRGDVLALFFVHQNVVELGGAKLPSADESYALLKLDGALAPRWQHLVRCGGASALAVAPDGRAAFACVAPQAAWIDFSVQLFRP